MKLNKIAKVLVALAAILSVSCQTAMGSKEFKLQEVVELDSGMVSGVTGNNPEITVFKGIPYAEPPVGELRWKAPQPVTGWDGVRECSEFGNSAMQSYQAPFMMWSKEFIIEENNQNEDCLTLNVWTDKTSTRSDRPVIVYIHGGGLTSGGSSCLVYDGEGIAEKGAVYVSINYRVGVFGFLSTEQLSAENEKGASGNYGLMDAVAALEWVQSNISQFGGDPENVTIMGQSAGSRMVSALLISPLAEGLFTKAVAESANPFSGTMGVIPMEDADVSGKKLLEIAGVNTIDELRELSSQEVFDLAQKVSAGPFGGFPAAMVNDGLSLTGTDLETYKNGKENRVVLMSGWTSGDTMLFGQQREEFTIDSYRKYAEDTYGVDAEKFLKLYPAANDEEANNQYNITLQQDRLNMFDTILAEIRAEQGDETYIYYFTHPMPAGGEIAPMGAFHTADVPYFLNYFYDDPTSRPFTDSDFRLGDIMSDYLINFAEYGDPNGKDLPLWDKYSTEKPNILELKPEPANYGGLSPEKYSFWKKYMGKDFNIWN